MIKVAVALAVLQQVEAGKLDYDAPVRRTGLSARKHMEQMLRSSSNWSTGALMAVLGGPAKVNEILEKSIRGPSGLLKSTVVREYIGDGSTRDRAKPGQPSGVRNTGTATDFAELFTAIEKGTLPLAPKQLQEFKRTLSLQGWTRLANERLLGDRFEITSMMHKTGSSGRFCGDGGIIRGIDEDGKPRSVLLIAMVSPPRKRRDYGPWISGTSSKLSVLSTRVLSSHIGATSAPQLASGKEE